MLKDMRQTDLYREAESLYKTVRQPGTGQISDATDIHVAPDGRHAVFTGVFVDKLDCVPATRLCQIDLRSGDTRVLTFGPNADLLPRYSPDSRHIAFLSDRHQTGDLQLYLLDLVSGAVRSTPAVAGWVEYLRWSPDGRRILLGVAGHGADVSGVQGAVTSNQCSEEMPSWMPNIETAGEGYRWRGAWMYDLATDCVRKLADEDRNIWEAAWCGNDAFVAVNSPGPGEGLWYTARLHVIDIETGRCRELYSPQDQLGWPAASPSGEHVAIVEAVCSDRWLVAGELRVIETKSGIVRRVDTRGVDVTHTEWRSDHQLLLAGHRGLDAVVSLYDVTSGTMREVWSSHELSTGGVYISVSGCNESGDCVLIGESFSRAPEVALIQDGKYHALRSFDVGYSDASKAIDAVERVSWSASDGIEIQGWLLRPEGEGPHPLIMYIHGGPVWHWRPVWLGRWGVHVLMLLRRNYAVFFPNPRGSSGRGQEFARLVRGDMGGADTFDLLSGVDYLIEKGIANRNRLAVTGVSYGGFMSSWLITQDTRFAAAVPVAPITNQVTEHLLSNIPHFVSLFLEDSYNNPGGKYFQRSPVMHAHKVKTPTLNICGALDRTAPPEEALQFHNALLENGCKSMLVTYPEEGHGVRKLPAAIDFAARVVDWVVKHT